MKFKILLLSTIISSCSEMMPSDGRFKVKDVQAYSKGLYLYQMVSVTGKNSWWLKDSANKYIVGDTVAFIQIKTQQP